MWTNENSRVQLWMETQQIDINTGNKHMNNSNAEHSFSPADVFIWTGSRNWSIPSITGRPVPISSARLDVWHSTGDTPGPTEITTGTVEAIDSLLSALNNKRQPPKGENGLLKNSEKNPADYDIGARCSCNGPPTWKQINDGMSAVYLIPGPLMRSADNSRLDSKNAINLKLT